MGQGVSHRGLELRMLVCDPKSLSFSPSAHFFAIISWFRVVSSARPAKTHAHRLAKMAKQPLEMGARLDIWSFPSKSSIAFCSGKRQRAGAFLRRNSPVPLTHLRRCPHRCHLVCDLSGPQLAPPDSRPPGAGRRVAVSAARRIPDGQRQGGPAALLPDRTAHLRVEPAQPQAAEAKGRITTLGRLDRNGTQRCL